MKNKIIGERIRTRRKQLKLTQTQLAELTGYSDKTAVSKIENGKTDIGQQKIAIFAKALKTTEVYLFGYVDDPDMKIDVQTITHEREHRLLAYFEQLTDQQQIAVLTMVEAIKQET